MENVAAEIQKHAKRYLFFKSIYDDGRTPEVILERVNNGSNRCINNLERLFKEIGFCNENTAPAQYLDYVQHRFGSLVFECMVEKMIEPEADKKSVLQLKEEAYREACKRTGRSYGFPNFEMRVA